MRMPAPSPVKPMTKPTNPPVRMDMHDGLESFGGYSFVLDVVRASDLDAMSAPQRNWC